MTFQDYESLGFVDFKGKVIDYVSTRTNQLKLEIHNDMPQSAYEAIVSKIEELQLLLNFIKESKLSSSLLID